MLGAPQKKGPKPSGFGPNPPKEEGGGDNLAELLSDLRSLMGQGQLNQFLRVFPYKSS